MVGHSSILKHRENDCKVFITATGTNATDDHVLERLNLTNMKSYTHKFNPLSSMSVQEYHIDAKEGSTYTIDFKSKSCFPAGCPKGAVVEVLVDGIRQDASLSESNGLPTDYVIEGRRVGRDQLRKFQFTSLKIEDFKGNYKVPDSVLKRSPKWLDMKKEVGQIRVNFYKVYELRELEGPYQGEPDYEPCTTVDHIGHIKLGEKVKCVTSLTKPQVCKEVGGYLSHNSRYPFHSIVVKFGIEEPATSQLSVSDKDKKGSTTALAAVGKGTNGKGKGKWRRTFKNTLGRVFCFGKGEPPAYDDLSRSEDIPQYKEFDEKK